MRRLLLLILVLTPMAMVACSQPRVTRFAPYFDGVFETTPSANTRDIADNMLELSHGLVSGVNEHYQVTDPRIIYNAALNKEGKIIDGNSTVLELEFLDSNEVQLSDAFGTQVTLRLQINADNSITAGSMTGKGNGVAALVSSKTTAGKLRKGKAYIMYRDKDVAMGQFQAEFDAFRINANFRALASSR